MFVAGMGTAVTGVKGGVGDRGAAEDVGVVGGDGNEHPTPSPWTVSPRVLS